MSRHKDYALYDENDCLIFVGNAPECAGYLGLTLPSFYSIKTRLDKGKISRRKGLIVEIEKEDKDER